MNTGMLEGCAKNKYDVNRLIMPLRLLRFLPTAPSTPAPKQVYLLWKNAQMHGMTGI